MHLYTKTGRISSVYLVLSLFVMGCTTASHFETRSYVVGDVFWKSILYPAANQSKVEDDKRANELEVFLRRAGVPFPNGSFIQIKRSENAIRIRNSRNELDHIETLIGPMDAQGKFYIEKKIEEVGKYYNGPGDSGREAEDVEKARKPEDEQ